VSSISAENTTEAAVSRLTPDDATVLNNAGMSSQEADWRQEGEQRRPPERDESGARAQWSETKEALKARRRQRIVGASALAVSGAALCGAFTLAMSADEPWHVWLSVLVVGGVIVLCLLLDFYVDIRIFKARYRDFAKNYIQSSVPEKWLSDPDLQNLLLLNRAQLNIYQEIATKDAMTASRHSRYAISLGFLILVSGAIGAIWLHDATSKIVVGALASLGSVLSGYISQTFLKAQAQARKQLNYYFHQPLVASYLLSAERIALKLKDGDSTKSAMLELIRTALLVASREEEPDSAPSSPRRRPRRSANAADAPAQDSQPGN
jgi:hypothetical protein